MLFLIIWVVFVVGLVWTIKDFWSFTGTLLFAFGAMANLISCGVFLYENINVNAYIATMQTRYDMLVYQYENDIYDNDNDLGKRDLMVDIQEWNEDLSYYKNAQDNFWIGIYIPNVYDQFKFISLGK